MSQPDLLTQLREARPVAPPELRERVRLVAAQAARPRRRITWRHALVVVVPVAAAVVAAAVLLPGGNRQAAVPKPAEQALSPMVSGAATDRAAAPSLHHVPAPAIPAPSRSRIQKYSASLELRLRDAAAVSEATKQAVKIAGSLNGYLTSVNVTSEGRAGYASLVLRIPVGHVRQAVSRLSALGTIVGENVSIQDLQGQVDATGRRIARLQRLVASWRALPQTADTIKHIDALTTQIERLQRGRAATVRTARLATVHLQLTTRQAPVPVHHGRGPLHGLGVIFHWAWIGAVYALAVGTPLAVILALLWLLGRSVRRRREEQLLSR